MSKKKKKQTKKVLTAERVRELLHYNAETGAFTWKCRRNRIKAGSKAGSRHYSGYIHIKVDGRHYMAHRLAFLWVHSAFPPHDVDHINGDRADNRFCNLRACTRAQNLWNARGKNGNAGLKGVFWSEQRGVFLAHICRNGEHKYLGAYRTAEDAHAAYCAAAKELFGEFARAA